MRKMKTTGIEGVICFKSPDIRVARQTLRQQMNAVELADSLRKSTPLLTTQNKTTTITATPYGATTLITRFEEARTANPPESEFSAKVKYVLFDAHFDPRGYDQCNLTIVLATFLGYLYSRNLLAVLIGFAAWFVYESVVWFFVPMFSPTIKRHLTVVESRDNEPVIDWILFMLSLATAWYILELTLVGEGWRNSAPADFPDNWAQWLALIVVVLVSLLSAFPDIFYLSAGLTLAAIFGVYFLNQSDFQLWTSLLAGVTVVYFYAWFKNPIAFHFVWNASFALFSALFITSLVHGVHLM